MVSVAKGRTPPGGEGGDGERGERGGGEGRGGGQAVKGGGSRSCRATGRWAPTASEQQTVDESH